MDDHTHYPVVIPMKAKDETFPEFKNYKAWAENSSGQSIQTTRDDKGGEYMWHLSGSARSRALPDNTQCAKDLNRTVLLSG